MLLFHHVVLVPLSYPSILQFTGHTASITGIQFSPSISSSRFASCSLDKTLRIWPPIGTEGRVEEIDLSSEG